MHALVGRAEGPEPGTLVGVEPWILGSGPALSRWERYREVAGTFWRATPRAMATIRDWYEHPAVAEWLGGAMRGGRRGELGSPYEAVPRLAARVAADLSKVIRC